mgnify:CR=1 FL=1
MEDALVQSQVCDQLKRFGVLILVVMEDALVLSKKKNLYAQIISLNPCCNGRCTRTGRWSVLKFVGD